MKTLKKKREITIERESAGFFIIDPESKKIIMTMKIADHTKAEITRNLIENKIITNKTVLKKEGKISFVKGKIENGDSYLERALKEAHEEAGIEPDDIILLQDEPIDSFKKKKTYTKDNQLYKEKKTVYMYIATLKKPYDLDNLNPSDRRHIAIALNKKEIENLLSDSEKKFRKKKNTQKTIKGFLENNLFQKDKNVS